MLANFQHQPVLLQEVIEGLAIKPEGIYLDGTFGRGGHSQAILSALGPKGRLLVIDKDPEAVTVATRIMAKDERLQVYRGSFSQLGYWVKQLGLLGQIDGILLDIGVSSPQLDDPSRGFSFLKDGPLDMRMDPEAGISVATWLAGATAAEIAEVLKTYGEERFAKRIAGAIVKAQAAAPITTTAHLAAIIAAANPAWERHKHPATRSFQALRIFINQELAELEQGLTQAIDVLKPQGRLVVISFHSLEDRIVKRFMRRQVQGEPLPAYLPVTQQQLKPQLRLIGRAIQASQEEIITNPRARSAVMRIAEKL